MYFKIVGIIFLTVLFVACGGSSVSDIEKDIRDISYIESSGVELLNPDRGFYDAEYKLDIERDDNMFDGALSKGYTLVYASLNLDEYNETAQLPTTLLETVEKNLKDADSSGVKLIFRIKYRSSIESGDPRRDIILGHLDQLKPLLQTYKKCISVVQAGVIGAWGEWHSFTGDYADDDLEYQMHRREIIERLTDIFPDKYIQIRTPMHKEQLFGAGGEYEDATTEGEITSAIAYSNDIRAKIGHHNDCVLASKTDMGTYPSNNIEFWKNYVMNDSYYAPVGGETCGIGDGEDELLSGCENAMTEFRKLQYSYLNDAYHPDVLAKWKDEGCYDSIKANLGYRLVAKKLKLVKSDNDLNVELSLENKGYAAPYIDYDVNFILKNEFHSYRVLNAIDTRMFYSEKEQNLTAYIDFENIEAGAYCLYIQIGQEQSSIRFSNRDIWEETTNANKLACEIMIEKENL